MAQENWAGQVLCPNAFQLHVRQTLLKVVLVDATKINAVERALTKLDALVSATVVASTCHQLDEYLAFLTTSSQTSGLSSINRYESTQT